MLRRDGVRIVFSNVSVIRELLGHFPAVGSFHLVEHLFAASQLSLFVVKAQKRAEITVIRIGNEALMINFVPVPLGGDARRA